jgi:Zn finger protein HypA/HybF involved in hydrogenase expression
VIPGKNDLETVSPLLAAQWHPNKNGPLSPGEVTSGSKRKVWWRCVRGHEWQASIKSRTQGAGCPVCAGKVVISGENDLESYSPELAEQWDREKNGALSPAQVSVFSNRRVWWKCSKGHEWQAKISDRVTKRSDCPYCTNRKVLAGFNDLKTVEPLVAAQWHPEKNDPLEPSMVLPGSTKRVWWRCTDCHEWKAVIYSRTGAQKCGCPVCAGKQPRIYKLT